MDGWKKLTLRDKMFILQLCVTKRNLLEKSQSEIHRCFCSEKELGKITEFETHFCLVVGVPLQKHKPTKETVKVS